MSETIALAFDPKDIYPLPTSAFEEYFFIDSRRDLPATEASEWVFTGSIDENIFAKAFREAVSREPLLFAVLKKERGRLVWTRPDPPIEPILEIERIDKSILEPTEGERALSWIDLRTESSMRCRLVVAPDGFALRFETSHALTDGAGLARFVAFLCELYGDLREGLDLAKVDARNERAPDPNLVKEREDLHIELPEKTSLWTDLRYLVSETFLWFVRRPWSISSLYRKREKSRESRTRGSRVHWRDLPNETFKRIVRRSKELGVTANSALTRDVFVALNKTREKFENPSFKRRFRILVPTNMRVGAHKRAPLVNLIGYSFLDRLSSECDRSDEFVREIDSQIKEIIRWSVGSFFLDGLKFFRAIPGALRVLTSRFFCHSTTVFSNLGPIERLSERPAFIEARSIAIDEKTRLVRVVGAPPTRPNTPICVAAIGTSRATTFSFCFDERVISREDAKTFIDVFWGELLASAGETETVN
ncbi:MAG: hypothetical protein IJM30_01810 [Thermoguttaceae bacterium]|nr:hypothetical protein [Thermoguttaceae bacterium]